VLTVVNRIYTRKQQSSEERRNIFGKSGKNLWGIDAPFDHTPKGGAPLKHFAVAVYGMFTVRKNLYFYFNYVYNLSGGFHVWINSVQFMALAFFTLFSF